MQVTINNSVFRGTKVNNQVFTLVNDLKRGSRGCYVMVLPNETIGKGRDKIRIRVEPENIIYPEGYTNPALAALQTHNVSSLVSIDPTQDMAVADSTIEETDEETMARIADRFDILEEMTGAAIGSTIRGMIVVGPPGIGKSHGVMKQLESYESFNKMKDVTAPPNYEIVKGAATALGLYVKLYNSKDEGQVIVFDDCDSILQDELSLNLLKAALDSSKKRKICWNSDSNLLKATKIPNDFDFHGSVIFITNINFDNVKSKKTKDHLAALMSRCHYLDLEINTNRERMLRIKQIHRTGDLFKHYDFSSDVGDLIVSYMEDNVSLLRELSLRAAIKIADLVMVNPRNWERLADSTVLKLK